MQLLKRFILLIVVTGLTVSCFNDLDDNIDSTSSIKDFVWKGMNFIYLYKDFKPDLANDRFSSDEAYIDYLNLYATPQDLFDDLVYSPTDKFSWLETDYISLEQFLSGTSVSNGMEFGLRRLSENSQDVFGYVRYVLPNTSAETQGVQRGYIFNAVNGIQLFYNSNLDNNLELLDENSYTINLATYDNNGTPETTDDIIIPRTESVTLTKAAYTEDPILKTEVINVDGNNVGYIMYNFFNRNFDEQLNNAFGTFASSNITDLVVDLRYNPGGSVNSAVLLSSLITGQFTGDILYKEEWNSELQSAFLANNPEDLLLRFTDNDDGNPLNSLNLNKVYVLTTGSSASASETTINGLIPYIDVVQIGDFTTGKYQASRTLYDSPDFRRENANPTHTYAIQPLTSKILNANDVTDYFDGLVPTIALTEDVGNLGVLGNINEPLLAAALANIQGINRMSHFYYQTPKEIGDSKMFSPNKNTMFIDKKTPVRK